MTAQTSKDAFKNIKKTGKRTSHQAEVLAVIEAAGRDGVIQDEIVAKVTVTGPWKRCSELEDDSLIFRVQGDTRRGHFGKQKQIVWRAAKYADEFGVTLPTSPPPKKTYNEGILEGIRLAIKQVYDDLSPEGRKKLKALYKAHE